MDISGTLAPKSDQLDYEDMLAGERTFTIKAVRRGPSAEQPVQIDLAEFDRPWRPGKTMRRVLVAVWGADASEYVGRQVTLYGDPTVRFGGIAVGGTRIKAVSHIDKPAAVMLMVSRGKRQEYVVQPITGHTNAESSVDTAAVEEYAELIRDTGSVDDLRELWSQIAEDGLSKHPQLIEAKDARKAELASEEEPEYRTETER